MVGGGISRDITTESGVRIWGGGIGDGQRSGELRTLWRDNTISVCWYGDGGHPVGRMIRFIGATGSVGGQGRRHNLHWGGV